MCPQIKLPPSNLGLCSARERRHRHTIFRPFIATFLGCLSVECPESRMTTTSPAMTEGACTFPSVSWEVPCPCCGSGSGAFSADFLFACPFHAVRSGVPCEAPRPPCWCRSLWSTGECPRQVKPGSVPSPRQLDRRLKTKRAKPTSHGDERDAVRAQRGPQARPQPHAGSFGITEGGHSGHYRVQDSETWGVESGAPLGGERALVLQWPGLCCALCPPARPPGVARATAGVQEGP